MKCPNDQTEMEKGVLTLLRGINYVSKEDTKGIIGFFFKKPISSNITAFKCSKCGKLELYTETEIK